MFTADRQWRSAFATFGALWAWLGAASVPGCSFGWPLALLVGAAQGTWPPACECAPARPPGPPRRRSCRWWPAAASAAACCRRTCGWTETRCSRARRWGSSWRWTTGASCRWMPSRCATHSWGLAGVMRHQQLGLAGVMRNQQLGAGWGHAAVRGVTSMRGMSRCGWARSVRGLPAA